MNKKIECSAVFGCLLSFFLGYSVVGQPVMTPKPLSMGSALKVLQKTNPEEMQQLLKVAPQIMKDLKQKSKKWYVMGADLLGRAALGYALLVLFAIANDQFTTRASKEYFSEGFHKKNMRGFAPKVYEWLSRKDSCTLWAIAWGISASHADKIAPIAGMLSSLISGAGKTARVPIRTTLLLMLGAIAVTAGSTLYAYHRPDSLVNLVESKKRLALRKSDRDRYIRRFLRNRGRVGRRTAEKMGAEKREQYYRVAVAHGALYSVGQPSIVVVFAVLMGLRVYYAIRAKKEKIHARRLIQGITGTEDNRSALEVVLKALK